MEIAAIVLLLLFWPVGVVLLWISDSWNTREKLIGTLVPPGGYLGIFVLGPVFALGTFTTVCRTATDAAGHVVSSSCPSGAAQTDIDIGAALLLAFYLFGPIVSAVYLAVRLRHNRGAADVVVSSLGCDRDRRCLRVNSDRWPKSYSASPLFKCRC